MAELTCPVLRVCESLAGLGTSAIRFGPSNLVTRIGGFL
jgi:hypothetical protein